MKEDWVAIAKPKSGGQGSVTKVKNKNNGEIGALKELHKNDAAIRRRMMTEIDSLAFLKVFGVPKILDHLHREFWEDPKSELFFVAEWIEGKTLQNFIETNPLSFDIATDYFRQLLEILRICHDAGILHRDIKPDNIIILDGTVHLVDFGMAKHLENESNATVAQVELGNRFLRLPEYAAGNHAFDQSSDLSQAVGIYFYMLTGVYPRQLLDAHGKMPHEKNIISMPDPQGKTLKDVNRIFRIGFQHEKLRRFQSAEMVLDYVNNIGKEYLMSEPEYLAELDEFFVSDLLERREEITREMRAISDSYKNAIKEKGANHSLQLAGSEQFNQANDQYDFNFTIMRLGTSEPQVSFKHTVQKIGEYYFMASASEAFPEKGYAKSISSDLDGAKELAYAQGITDYVKIADLLRKKFEEILR